MDHQDALVIGTPMALEQLFVAGGIVHPTCLLNGDHSPCEWSVKIRTGLIPDMSGKLLRHRKRYFVREGFVRGVNVFRTDLRWGYHTVLVGWGLDGRPSTVLDYDVGENPFFFRTVVDRLRTTEDPDLLVGKLYVGDWFGGYFTLARLR